MKRNLVSRRQFIQSTAAVSLAVATPKIAWGQTSADVMIIGAGMSGLNAALLLEEQGLDCWCWTGRLSRPQNGPIRRMLWPAWWEESSV